jgi:ribosomal protein S18 acetylase RimI-like enzyme
MINIDSEVSKVGLLGVDVNERGKKIGSSMLKYFEKEAMDNNQREIEIYTQIENSNACRFYNAMGYDKENVQYIYHLWS